MFPTTAKSCSQMIHSAHREDDPHYARVLCDLSRDKGFKVLVAARGAEALALAANFIRLPSRWTFFFPTCWVGRF